jgi:hypothetical protein
MLTLALVKQKSKLALRQLPTAADKTLEAFGPEPSPTGVGSSISKSLTFSRSNFTLNSKPFNNSSVVVISFSSINFLPHL